MFTLVEEEFFTRFFVLVDVERTGILKGESEEIPTLLLYRKGFKRGILIWALN